MRGYSLFTHCSYDNNTNKHAFYSGKDRMKKFCKDMREHAAHIINCEEKNVFLTKDEEKKIQKIKILSHMQRKSQ